MCGIAGYSLGNGSEVSRTLSAQALLAGIAERGADAVGYAYRAESTVAVHKQQTGASALLDCVALPDTTDEVLLHVRDYTKGHPSIVANNHPIRHGDVVGVHNGIIANDDDLLAHHGLEREQPEMTVDSEAIFALVDAFGTSRRRSSSSSARWPPPGSTSESRTASISPAVSAARCGSRVAVTRCFSRPRALRSRSSSALSVRRT